MLEKTALDNIFFFFPEDSWVDFSLIKSTALLLAKYGVFPKV